MDRDSLFGEHGYYTEIRRVTDADGSVWWWPVNLKREAARVEAGKIDDDKKPTGKATIEPHRTPGKAGWFAGVHSVLFRTRFAGIDYDAPTRVLTWQPLSALGDFEWQNLPFGREQFSIKLALTGKNPSATVSNPNAQPVTVRLRLPGQAGTKLSISGQSLPTTPAPYFGESSVTGEFQVSSGGTVTVSLKNGE